ncbi:hypothetical protein [Aeromicrobium sp.]
MSRVLLLAFIIGVPMAGLFVIAWVLDEAAKVAESRRVGRES